MRLVDRFNRFHRFLVAPFIVLLLQVSIQLIKNSILYNSYPNSILFGIECKVLFLKDDYKHEREAISRERFTRFIYKR